MNLLREKLLPVSNQFAYVQANSPYGAGEFLRMLKSEFAADERLALSEVKDREGIVGSIREILGRGR